MTKRAIKHVELVKYQKHNKKYFRMIQQIEAENADGFHYYPMVPRWRQIGRVSWKKMISKIKMWERR